MFVGCWVRAYVKKLTVNFKFYIVLSPLERALAFVVLFYYIQVSQFVLVFRLMAFFFVSWFLFLNHFNLVHFRMG